MTYDLVVIVGQTAAGKSALALQIAKKIPSEIVAADSRTVYKGLDIGTAKPTREQRTLVTHHLLDIVRPDQNFNVAEWQTLALKAIVDIQKRHKLPILVGGSGLYVDSILCNYVFDTQPQAQLRLRGGLESLTTAQLQAQIKQLKLIMPENCQNRRYLIRTLEKRQPVKPISSWRAQTLVVGLRHKQDVLKARITDRLQAMLTAGLLTEIQQALRTYPPTCEALKSNIYAAFRPYFKQDISLDQACADFIKRDLALAKKQITWFKRHPQIHWFSDLNEAYDYICPLVL